MTSIDICGWPTAHRNERDVRSHFGALGSITACDIWNTPSTVRVTYASPDGVARAVQLLHGSRPPGSDVPLDVRASGFPNGFSNGFPNGSPNSGCMACKTANLEIARLRAELDRLAGRGFDQGSDANGTFRRGIPDRAVRFAPVPRHREDDSESRKRAREPDDFFDTLTAKLGDKVGHHLTSRLPDETRTAVKERCNLVMVIYGKHHSVKDSRQYMVDMRNALKFPGMLSVFFEWSTFRIVLFVDSAELDRDLVFATLRGQQFVNRFGDFNTENITEIVVNDG